jgi:uncharacterized protein YjiS (DUF1127 family)
MAHSPPQASSARPRAGFGNGLASLLAAKAEAFSRWRKSAGTRRILAALTDDERRDIGQDGPRKPVIPIKAGLITNLLSLR